MAASPRNGRRVLWYGVTALGWLVVAGLAVEFAAHLLPMAREANNPYMQARWHGAHWPRSDAESALASQVARAEAAMLKQLTHEEQMAAHAIYLLSQDSVSRTTYSDVYHRSLYICQAGQLCLATAFDESGLDLAALAQELIPVATESPAFELGGGSWRGWTCHAHTRQADTDKGIVFATVVMLTSTSSPGIESSVCLVQHPYKVPPAESANRYPFIDFKPHGASPDGGQFFGFPEFRLNNHGFRDDDVVVPRPAQVFRIACVGASTTVEGPTNGFTYPNLVERFLRERYPGRQIEVVNCGVPGIATEGERARFADYLMLDPNVLIYYNGINQICHSDLHRWMQDHLLRAVTLVASRAAAVWLGDLLGPKPDELREIFALRGQANVFAMADAAKDFGVLPILTTFCHPDGPNLTKEERVYYEYDARMNWVGRGFTLDTYLDAVGLWNDLLREECAARDIAMIDVAAQLTGGGQVFGDLCHMKDYGIEQKARVVAAGLEPYVEAFYASGAPPAP